MIAALTRGALVEYGMSLTPAALVFEFSPESITRSRTVTLTAGAAPGTTGGHDFSGPGEAARASQSAVVQPESLSADVLFDATDRLESGDPVAAEFGIQPELDVLRGMVLPKPQGPGGARMLAALGLSAPRAFDRSEAPSVLLFLWGRHVLPVFLTSVQVTEQAFLPSLAPYRAKASLQMQLVESDNPFYVAEKSRQAVSAALVAARAAAGIVGGLW